MIGYIDVMVTKVDSFYIYVVTHSSSVISVYPSGSPLKHHNGCPFYAILALEKPLTIDQVAYIQ